ncbi:MAG: CsgE family curli-type amyloid fiber assembly protein [Gallionella sp.]
MRKLITKLIICTQVMLCSIALVNQACAEEETNSVLREGTQYVNSIEDLVFDQTITPQGREFYRAFIKAWSNHNNSERYHVLVYERPAAVGANKLWVEYRLRKLYSGVVRMSEQSVLEQRGAYAALAVLQGITAIQAEENEIASEKL